MRHSRQNTAQRLMCGAAAIAILSFAAAAQAEERPFAIEPQSLSTALAEFGAQSGHAVMAPMNLLDAKTTRGFSRSAEPEIALAQLLDGTGLTYRKTGDTFAIVSASDPQSGSAAGDGADAGTVQALVVTAQKREENIQDVPIAMSAFTQEDLTRSQVAGGPDLMTQVPNFTFTKTNFSGYSIQIRGIGTQAISATTDAAVAVAFNNTPFIRNRFFEQEFYDLERVEVLRGPQGTLYGRNATAGVVNILSAKPKFAYEAKLSGDVGNYNSIRLEGTLNIPLVEDKVALRLAGAWTKRDGYDTNQITGNRIDGRDLWSTRATLRLEPTDTIHANLVWEHFQENDDRLRSGKQLCNRDFVTAIGGVALSPPLGMFRGVNPPLYQQYFSQGCKPASLYSPDSFEAPNGFSLPYYYPLQALGVPVVTASSHGWVDPYVSTSQSRDLRVIESTVNPNYRAKSDTAELQIAFDLTHELTLTSETGYLADALFSSEDYNRFNTTSGVFFNPTDGGGILSPGPNGGIFCDPQIGCADRLVAVDLSTAKSRQFSQELRLSSNYEGAFNFSLGANLLRYDTEDKYYVFINTITMYAILSPYAAPTRGAYSPGADNQECLTSGFVPPDPTQAQQVDGCEYVDPNPIGSLNDLGHNYFLSRNPYKLISYAVFGEAYYDLTSTLKATAGLRWTVDKKEAPRIPSWILAAGTVGYPVAEVGRQTWREPTGRLSIDWKPDLSFTDETLLYASFSRGYKAGGSNPPPSGTVFYCLACGNLGVAAENISEMATKPKTFAPEFVNAYELGSKNTLLDGALTLNGGAFYYDYKGYQISQIIDRSAVNYNFDAKVWGLELEADWRPLENLRLGLKMGYEKTRMANGSKAIDIMDRTNGHTDWFVTRPFPTLASNCILPTYLIITDGVLNQYSLGAAGGGNPGPCELAYVLKQTVYNTNWNGESFNVVDHPEINGGAGFYKDLSGHELPNAPHYTATLTADYTLPLPSDWLMTLHSDLYYQSEAWTRVFNTPGYDKLKAYTNVNLAAIFSNEDAGWKVMAYVKNVFDKDNITGAFLNSDDTGLTTNVFLNEPRLYGLRVTKEWTGGHWWTGADPNHAGSLPLTIEISGQVQRQDAPYVPTRPDFASTLPPGLDTLDAAQNTSLDWGDERSAGLTWQPSPDALRLSTNIRYGRTNGSGPRLHRESQVSACGFAGSYASFCQYDWATISKINFSDVSGRQREEHVLLDFSVGKDVDLGGARLAISAGLGGAKFQSDVHLNVRSVPNWVLPAGWYLPGLTATHTLYESDINVRRTFEGGGPVFRWDGAKSLFGDNGSGELLVDASLGTGVLFGQRKTEVSGSEQTALTEAAGFAVYIGSPPTSTSSTGFVHKRNSSATVPIVDLSVGLSYEVQRFKISSGYRWARYFNVLDGGYKDRENVDRTIDGPYFKIAVGFGG